MVRTATLLIFLATFPLAAQTPYGRITGRVVDSAGAVVAGAAVRVTNIDTNLVTSASSDAQGNYEARNLIPGNYRLIVELQGFKRYERGPMEVRVGDVLTVDVGLELGAVSDSITVKAEAPLLDSSTAVQGQLIDGRRLLELPMPYSNALYLNQLAPGVIATTPPTGNWQVNQPGNASGISVNGTTTASNEYVMDGTPNMRESGFVAFLPPPEILQEVRVQSAAYDASVGHFTGAQINMVTKSGTNSLHGVLNFEHNDRALMTRSFFVNKTIYDTRTGPVTQDKTNTNFPGTRMNWFRGVASGPVYIPKLYGGRNRTFFTFGYTYFRRDFVASVTSKTVPTLAERTGDFSALLALGARYQIYDPATIAPAAAGRFSRLPLPGNIVPASRFDPVSRKLLPYIELPNAGGTADGLNNFTASPLNRPRQPDYITRIDHMISSNHRFFISAPIAKVTTNFEPNQWMSDIMRQNQGAKTGSVTVDDVLLVRAHSVVNLRYGISRLEITSMPLSAGFDLAGLGLPASLVKQIDPALAALPVLNFSTYSAVNAAQVMGTFRTSHFLSGSVAHNRSNHSLRMGAEYRRYSLNAGTFGNISPSYSFDSTWTGGPLDNSPAAPVGQDFAAFLLGAPNGGGVDRNSTLAEKSAYLAVFFQDEWKLTRKLTLTLGLRYELERPTTERHNRANRGFDFSAANPVGAAAEANYAKSPIPEIPAANFRVMGGILFAGLNGVPRGLWQTDSNNFAPRAGLAYQVGAKMVLRAGYGIFFENIGADKIDALQQGFSQRTTINPSLDNGLTFRASMANPFPDGLLAPAGASAGLKTFLGQAVNLFWPDRRPGYAQRWSLSIQHELPRRVLVELGYVGNRGTGLPMSQDLNSIPARYLSRLPVRDQSTIDSLSAAVTNPFFGLPEFTGASLQGRTVPRSQLLRPYPEFSSITGTFSSGFSWYHALQVRAERRLSNGFTIQGSYTWSKFMQATEKLNPTDEFPTHSISDLDRPQNFVVSGIYELPVGKGRRWFGGVHGWARQVLSGWSVQGIYHGQSGPAISFGNVIFNGNLHDIVLPRFQRTVDRWFNTDAGFERNNNRQLGSNLRAFPLRLAGLRSDGFNSFDLSAMKDFAITERLRFQLRAEAQDALNHAMFAAPNTTPTSTAFGQVNSTVGSGQRIFTVGARVAW
jgi:hypothetical protein